LVEQVVAVDNQEVKELMVVAVLADLEMLILAAVALVMALVMALALMEVQA
jgi:hypothetical protein